jgi:Na+/H+-translocating membrane pyrophosphatase
VSNPKTGIWSAVGAVLGGVAGAVAGQHAARYRPRVRYAREQGPGDIEDAMVVGGAAGAVVGAFLGGTIAGEDEKPPCPTLP